MNISDFNYPIPEGQIAQHPLKKRDTSRLFVLHKKTGEFEHRNFREITDYFRPGDLLVLNDTKVVPVRLPGHKPSGGKAEITLIKELSKNRWEALVKGLHEGKILLEHGISADVSRINGKSATVMFKINSESKLREDGDIKDLLNEIGVMPLPIYIKRDAVKSDLEQYQTIYCKNEGAIAAPTAGLHFTDSLLIKLRKQGVLINTVTLHVGYGTFKPVAVTDIKYHKMDTESYEIPEATAEAINSARSEGRRVIAVGTTVTRTLEASANSTDTGMIKPGSGEASIFIYPGYKFKVIDILLTNFHLPKSTPMMLASAFTGLDTLKKAYAESEKKGYRFFSYGDAMLII